MASGAPFTHLHVHTEYSLLDGMAKIDALCKTSAEHGAGALAMTDHGVMYGAMEFYRAAQRYGLTPIIGVEAYIAPNRFEKTARDERHVTLLAQDDEGYRNLITLVSLGFTEGYHYKPRIDLDAMATYSRGIICLSGCLSGTVQSALKANDYTAARDAALAYRHIYGDRFYLELMRHGLADQQHVEDGMLRLHRELEIPLVATNDSHYVAHEDHVYHDMFLCMQTGATLENDKRFRFEGDQFYLKSDAEMRERFRDLPEACDATAAIAQRISPKIESLEKSKQFHIPTFPLPEHKKIDPDGTPLTPEVYLRRLCLGGLNKRYGADNITREPRFRERMNYELGVIEEMRLSSYFLIVWDFIKYARDNGIPVGPGRGSAVGSIVAYCLAITAIDPLKYDLSFERFLNPGRRDSMPDIDTDFCIDGRDDVIAYVAHKYGAARVTGIVTFSEIKARNAIRDAGRMLGVPLGTVDRVAKLIPNGPGQRALGIAEAEHAIPELAQLVEADPATRALLETGKRLEGYIRNIGSHAAAVVIADDDITRYVPVVDFRKKSGSLSLNCQFDMRWVEELGLLKMDFLGLRNLTVMRAAQNAIRETSDPTFSVDDIPDDDTTTFEMLARGETSGVFQLESAGMRRAIVDLRPDSFADIVALVALYRPGPMEWIPQYISNKHGRTTPAYLHPKLEGILADTHGIAIFQEQITTIAREIAGYSFTEADKLRKVVGKKILAEVPAERAKFISGAVGSGTSATVAEAIFKFIEPFAGYGFGKSHAVAYGRISFQTAYLKAHYPGPYFAALLSSVNDKPDKLRDYMLDARRCGFTILPPDINESRSGFVARDKEIRFGFAAVRGITETSISDIVRERDRGGPYASVADLIRRTRSSGLQKRTVEALVKVGAFDRIGDERAAQLTALDTHFKSADHAIAQDAMGQGSLFGFEDLTTNVPPIRQLRASRAQLLAWEQEGLGMFVSGHPMDDVAPLVRARGALPIAEALRCPDTTRVLTAGLVTLMKRVLTRNGNPMIVAQIEDESGRIEIVIFPNKYLAQHESVCEGRMLFVTGSVRARAVRSGAPQDTDEGEDAEHAAEQKSIIVSGVEEITRETIVA